MKIKLLFVFGLIAMVCSAQKGKLLKGQVLADVKDVQGINVVNLALRKEVATDHKGLFSITAKPGDTLLFSAVQLKSRKIVIEKEDFDYLPYLVKMEVNVTQLKEVVIQQSNISAESLGLVQKGTKTYTPAERKLRTAGDFKPIHLLAILGGSMPFDPIINKINGKTDRLKKEIVVEKHQMVQVKLGNMFDEDFLTKELNVKQEYLDGFIVYVSENPKVKQALKEKNKTLVTFLLGELAVEYNKMVADAK
ncbi:hypothetical protein [Flavobacterium cauense]|uniref:hypothetical protein n=1 Tax=Flavobacterium cauense TaxID=510946 RepID=UPI0004140AE7|nr:hypothetical protein [Flavobacterium cauense]